MGKIPLYLFMGSVYLLMTGSNESGTVLCFASIVLFFISAAKQLELQNVDLEESFNQWTADQTGPAEIGDIQYRMQVNEVTKEDLEAALKQAGGDLNSLSNPQLEKVSNHFGIAIKPTTSSREETISTLSKDPQVVEWKDRVSVSKVALATGAVAAGGVATVAGLGIANRMKQSVDERVEQAKQDAIDRASSTVQEKASVASKVITESGDSGMVGMIKNSFGKWLIESGYTTTELTYLLDADASGDISREEFTVFIEKLSGKTPPKWVIDTIINIIDSGGDGTVTVEEWWEYLATLGFSVPTILTPEETAELNEIIEPSEETVVEEYEDEEVNKFEVTTEVETPTPVQTELSSPPEPIIIEPVAEAEVEVEEEPKATFSDGIDTPLEALIERLEKARLSSEYRAIIQESETYECHITVDRTERTLMVSDEYRGGMTVKGLLDGGPYSVQVMLPKDESETVNQLKKGQTITVSGHVVEWSSGLNLAKLKGVGVKRLL